jgi:ribosomal protein S8
MTGIKQSDGKGNIPTMSTDNKKIEIPWSMREDANTIAKVANYKKNVVNIVSKKEFITSWDAVQYLSKELKNIKDRVVVDGDIEINAYNGKYRTNFNVNNIYLAKEEDLNGTVANIDIYFNKDSFDDSLFADDKVLNLSGYVSQYDRTSKAQRYFPMQFVLNASKINMEDPDHVKKFKYIKTFMQTKQKSYQHIAWKVNVFSGANEVEWSEDMLTDAQKEQVELGLASIESFKPRESIAGSNMLQFRLIAPVLKGIFTEGIVDTEMSQEEFEELIFKTETKVEVVSESSFVASDEEDLFS